MLLGDLELVARIFEPRLKWRMKEEIFEPRLKWRMEEETLQDAIL